ncbi:MAG: efflux RND transporter periplasmic adaptor subunit [Deltaproteobacteria bacterium]|nr:efflux RND transporter periplasmic adaptor subunit [Deltaproteobacteria bacterium]
MRKVIWVLVLAAAVGGGGYLVLRLRPEEASATSGATARVRRGDLVEVASASGTVKPDVSVDVKPRASGEVTEVLVEEGDTVQAGQLLVTLDTVDLERNVRSAQNTLARAEAALAQAEASQAVARAERSDARARSRVRQQGVELGLISEEEGRSAATTSAVANANVTLRGSQVDSARVEVESARLTVEEAERRLAEAQIRAPVAGTVLAVNVEKGSIVASGITAFTGGTTLLTIADLGDLRVIGDLDEAQVGQVLERQEVTIRVDAYPDRSFAGTVRRVSPLGEEVSNIVTFEVEVVVTDPDAGLLRSGMSADLDIVTARHPGALLVPLSTIHGDSGHRWVLLSGEVRRPVRTGATDGTDIIIVEGLKEGDEVSTAGPAGPPGGESGFGGPPPPPGGM